MVTLDVTMVAPPSTQACPAPRLRLLVVDDDPTMCDALARAIEAHLGWEVLTALEPSAAARLYDGVDAVISDWNMPDGGGARVLAECPKPVVIYSAAAVLIDHPHRLSKPSSVESLRNAVLGALHGALHGTPR